MFCGQKSECHGKKIYVICGTNNPNNISFKVAQHHLGLWKGLGQIWHNYLTAHVVLVQLGILQTKPNI